MNIINNLQIHDAHIFCALKIINIYNTVSRSSNFNSHSSVFSLSFFHLLYSEHPVSFLCLQNNYKIPSHHLIQSTYLGVSAANLYNVSILLGFCVQGLMQGFEAWQQCVVDLNCSRNVHGSWVCVI